MEEGVQETLLRSIDSSKKDIPVGKVYSPNPDFSVFWFKFQPSLSLYGFEKIALTTVLLQKQLTHLHT